MNRSKNPRALLSITVCAILVLVGVIRLLSYSEGTTGDIVRHSFLRFIGYDPETLFSAQFFKLLATPSVVAMIYFIFRWRNAGAPAYSSVASFNRSRRIDFESPVLRAILTSLITVHWFAMEWWKFNAEGFCPWSPLENRTLNIVVLLASGAFAFWGMKYLSFDAVTRDQDSAPS